MNAEINKIEEPIRSHVRALNDAGWLTDSSCGHEMWVRVLCPIDRQSELAQWAKAFAGTNDIRIDRDYGWENGKHATVRFPKPENHGDGLHRHVLLKVQPSDHLFFVLRVRDYNFVGDEGHDNYFYDEHTCPTNWTNEIVAVIENGDPDPHGFATFVAARPEPAAFEENDYAYMAVFPEITKSEEKAA